MYCKSCLKKIHPSKPEHQGTSEQNFPTENAEKVENISFHGHRSSLEEKNPPANKHTKRKEINLDELRKALEESLSGPEKEPFVASAPQGEEKEENSDKKKVINPGQTIKF